MDGIAEYIRLGIYLTPWSIGMAWIVNKAIGVYLGWLWN